MSKKLIIALVLLSLPTTVKANQTLTKGQVLEMICNYTGTGQLATSLNSHWAQGYHDYAYNYNWIDEPLESLDAIASTDFFVDVLFEALNIVEDPYLLKDNPLMNEENLKILTLYDMGIDVETTDLWGTYFTHAYPITTTKADEILASLTYYFENEFGITDFRYQQPQAERPVTPDVPSLDYFIDVYEYMFTHHVTEYEIVFPNFNETNYNDLISKYDIYNNIHRAYTYVRGRDHEIAAFYEMHSENITYDDEKTILTLGIRNDLAALSPEEILEYRQKFISRAQRYCTQLYKNGIVNVNMTDREKALTFYKQIAYDFKYDAGFDSLSYNGYGMFINEMGVCQAYVSLYNILCRMSGVYAQGVSGNSQGDKHIWSYVNIEGENTYVDPTWADPVPDQSMFADETWFDVTRAKLSETHKFDPIYDSGLFEFEFE